MGQYYAIYNLTKKEMITTHRTCSGAKLLEFSTGFTAIGLCLLLANSNGRGGGDINAPYKLSKTYKRLKNQPFLYKKMQNALQAVQGRWAGDQIVIQGDYAREDDPSFIPENDLDIYKDISSIVLKALSVNNHLSEAMSQGYFFDKYGAGAFTPKDHEKIED